MSDRDREQPPSARGLALTNDKPMNAVSLRQKKKKAQKEDGILEQVFGTPSRPAHIGSGLASGAWKVAQGVGMGVGALISAPIAGAMNEGASGLMKGAAIGVVNAVVLPVAGVFAGAKQVRDGVVNTPEAFRESGKGKVYTDGVWVDKYRILDELYQELEEQYTRYKAELDDIKRAVGGVSASSPVGGERKVVDHEYYDVLKVPTNATTAQIRKSYYKLAMDCHPDKNPDDPGANEKFQIIGEAYQVLGDETRRQQYDTHGKAATDKMDFLDHSLFFAMLFGSEAMEPFVGKLKLASIFDSEDEKTALHIPEDDEIEQAFREVKLAITLRARLQPYVRARMENNGQNLVQWKKKMTEIAEGLCHQSFGAPLVDSVGFIYENSANHFIGKREKFLGGTVAKFQHQKRQFDTIWAAIQSAQKANKAAKKAQKKQKDRADEDSDAVTEEDVEAMAASLKHILSTMLHICIADVNTTVRAACKKCLNDKGVDETEQRIRSDGLLQLGKIFQQCAASHEATNQPVDPREQFQEAYVKAAQKADNEGNPN